MNKILHTALRVGSLLLAGAVGAAELTTQEVARIESGLGITLTPGQKTELAQIVKPNAPLPQWRSEAETRIEQHRKADLNVQVVDVNGNPVEGAQIRVTLRRNAFRFSGVMNLKDFTDEDENLQITTNRYRELFLALFNSGGLNNGLKPKQRVGNEPLLPAFFSWAQTNQVPVRGHLLVWPGVDDESNHLTPEVLSAVQAVEAALTNGSSQVVTDGLKTDLKQTLDSETAEWASRWPVYEWDVINETLGNHRIQDVLGEDQMAEWFRIAESSAVQTNCKLLINEYKLISGFSETLKPGYYTDRRDRYMVNIDRIIADGGPISRIGFQSRLQHEKMDPQTYYDRLEEFGSRYGLEMAGTEFEVVDRDPLVETYFPYVYTEEERAQMTEEILTSYYSHPLASGLSAWDFMEANTSSMCYYDGTVKLNGLVWYYLHRIRYTTDVTTHSSTSGHTTVRGYKGDYDVLVQFGGRDYPAALSLNSNTTLQIEVETASAVRTVDFQPVADTFAHKFKPTENFGTDPGIDLRSLSADSSRVRLGYMQFEITNIPYAIESVELHLYSNDEPDPVRFLQVTDNNWTETGLFWNNRPATGSLITTAQATSAGTRFTADLTSYITATGTWSIAIDETGDTADSLASKESANPPVLRVVYRAPDTDSDGIFDDLDTDDDGDHLPDDYEGLYGFDPLTADHNSDPDEDGMDTIFEFATGQNPIIGATNPASRGFAISSATDTLMLRLDERQGLASHNLKLVLEHSTNLTSWAVIDPLDPGSAGFTVIQRVTNTVSDAYGPIDLRLIELVPTQGHGYFRSHVETTP